MKLAKSLLLGSAAALVAGTAAQAADLPYKKAAPVEYVRVCDWTGAGYFYIPGTDSCLKIEGYARAEFQLNSTPKYLLQSAPTTIVAGRTIDQTGFRADGRIAADVRTQTAYGTLRTYVRYDVVRNTGSEAGIGPGTSAVSANLDKGFVQFAGISAGRMQSLFDDGADPYGFDGVATTDASTQTFNYTATLAGGFSLTGSVEDPVVRRGAIAGPIGAAYSGTEVPDLIGVARVDQAWGSAQLSGAYHEVNTNTVTATKDDDGFAVRASLLFKLPFLAAGDEFRIEGGYEEGAYSYQNSNGIFGGYNRSIYTGGYVSNAGADAVALPTVGGGYALHKAEGYSFSGGFQHYITPTVNNIIFGSYDHVEYGSAVSALAYTAGGIGPTSSYRIADQINWFPVKGLQIGLEVMYIKVDQKVVGVLPTGISKDPDTFVGHFRIERDF